MFFKKKKRVICPFPVIMDVIREAVQNGDDDTILIFDFNNESHMIGMFKADINKDSFPVVYTFDAIEEIWSFEGLESVELDGIKLGELRDEVWLIDSDGGGKANRKFPWYPAFEKYVREV